MTNRLRERRQGERGFTLIELLIVIVILGILAAVVVFSVGGITDRGSNSACQANVETVNIASESYRTQNAGYAATLPALQTAGFLKTIPGTVAGDGLSFAVSNPGGTDYTVTYDPVTGLATSTCPSGSTGGGTTTTTTGGGGGTTTTTTPPATTTTAAPVACTFQSFTPTTVDASGQSGTLNQTYTLTANMSGDCTGARLTAVAATIDRNDGGFSTGDGPFNMTPNGTNSQWTISMNSTWSSGWIGSDPGVAIRFTFTGSAAPGTFNGSLVIT